MKEKGSRFIILNEEVTDLEIDAMEVNKNNEQVIMSMNVRESPNVRNSNAAIGER